MKSFKVNSVFLLICMVFTLASCMSPDPGSTQGENALKENISQESKIPVTISNFTKTNGIKREVMGQPIYTMEFSTQIRIGQKSGFTGEYAILKNIIPIEKFGEYYSIYWHDLKKTILYEGALIGYDGEITFEKTEKGWRSTNIKLNNFKLLSNPSPLDKFIGIWYIEKNDNPSGLNYLKIEKGNEGRYIFCEGYMYEKAIIWAQEYDHVPLEFSNGKAICQFSSDGFRPSHGQTLNYSVTLTLLPENKLQYSLWVSAAGGYTETKEAIRYKD